MLDDRTNPNEIDDATVSDDGGGDDDKKKAAADPIADFYNVISQKPSADKKSGKDGGDKSGWWTPERAEQAVTHLQKNAGLSRVGAQGLVSRWAGVEAKGGPGSVNPKSGATGIAQWLRSRQKEVPSDFGSQLDLVAQELNSTEPKAAKQLRKAQTPEDAARGAAMFERAEGWDPVNGTDNFVKPTIQTMGKLFGGGAKKKIDPVTDFYNVISGKTGTPSSEENQTDELTQPPGVAFNDVGKTKEPPATPPTAGGGEPAQPPDLTDQKGNQYDFEVPAHDEQPGLDVRDYERPAPADLPQGSRRIIDRSTGKPFLLSEDDTKTDKAGNATTIYSVVPEDDGTRAAPKQFTLKTADGQNLVEVPATDKPFLKPDGTTAPTPPLAAGQKRLTNPKTGKTYVATESSKKDNDDGSSVVTYNVKEEGADGSLKAVPGGTGRKTIKGAKVAEGPELPQVKRYSFEDTGKFKLNDGSELNYLGKGDIWDKYGHDVPAYRFKDADGETYTWNESEGLQDESLAETEATVPVHLVPFHEKSSTPVAEAQKREAFQIASQISQKYAMDPTDVYNWTLSSGFTKVGTKEPLPEDRFYQQGDTQPADDTYSLTRRQVRDLADYSIKQKAQRTDQLLQSLSTGTPLTPELLAKYRLSQKDVDNSGDAAQMALVKGRVAQADMDRFSQEIKSGADSPAVRAANQQLADFGLDASSDIATKLVAARKVGRIDEQTLRDSLADVAQARVGVRAELEKEKAEKNYSASTRRGETPDLTVTSAEVDDRLAQYQKFALTAKDVAEAQNKTAALQRAESDNSFKGLIHNGIVAALFGPLGAIFDPNLTGDMAKARNTLIGAPAMTMTGDTLKMLAGVTRPFSSDTAAKISREGGKMEQVAGSIGDNNAIKYVMTVGTTLVPLVIASESPLGMVGGFAATGAARKYGEGATGEQTFAEGGKQGAIGGVFGAAEPVANAIAKKFIQMSAPDLFRELIPEKVLGGEVGEAPAATPPSMFRRIFPGLSDSTIDALKKPAVASLVKDVIANGESWMLNPEIRKLLTTANVIKAGARVGTITVGTLGVEKASGASGDEARSATIQNVLMDAILTYLPYAGGSALRALNAFKGKTFDVVLGDGTHTVTVGDDGRIDTWDKIPHDFVDATIYAKGVTPKPGDPGVEAVPPTQTAAEAKSESDGMDVTHNDGRRFKVLEDRGEQLKVKDANDREMLMPERKFSDLDQYRASASNDGQKDAQVTESSENAPNLTESQKSSENLKSGQISSNEFVTERSVTLEAQRDAMLDKKLPDAIGVLYTEPKTAPATQTGVSTFHLPDGTLHINNEKFEAKYGKKPGQMILQIESGTIPLEDLIGGKAVKSDDTTTGTALVTKDADGNELNASKIADERLNPKYTDFLEKMGREDEDGPELRKHWEDLYGKGESAVITDLTPEEKAAVKEQVHLDQERFGDKAAESGLAPAEEVVASRNEDRPIDTTETNVSDVNNVKTSAKRKTAVRGQIDEPLTATPGPTVKKSLSVQEPSSALERYQDRTLGRLGYSEEQKAALSPDDRARILKDRTSSRDFYRKSPKIVTPVRLDKPQLVEFSTRGTYRKLKNSHNIARLARAGWQFKNLNKKAVTVTHAPFGTEPANIAGGAFENEVYNTDATRVAERKPSERRGKSFFQAKSGHVETLWQAVRNDGGIKSSKSQVSGKTYNKGELDRVKHIPGIINEESGRSAEDMAGAMYDAGYLHDIFDSREHVNGDQLLEAIEADHSGEVTHRSKQEESGAKGSVDDELEQQLRDRDRQAILADMLQDMSADEANQVRKIADWISDDEVWPIFEDAEFNGEISPENRDKAIKRGLKYGVDKDATEWFIKNLETLATRQKQAREADEGLSTSVALGPAPGNASGEEPIGQHAVAPEESIYAEEFEPGDAYEADESGSIDFDPSEFEDEAPNPPKKTWPALEPRDTDSPSQAENRAIRKLMMEDDLPYLEALRRSGFVNHHGLLVSPRVPDTILKHITPEMAALAKSQGVEYVLLGSSDMGVHGGKVSMSDGGVVTHGLAFTENLIDDLERWEKDFPDQPAKTVHHVFGHEVGHTAYQENLTDAERAFIDTVPVESNYGQEVEKGNAKTGASAAEENFCENFGWGVTQKLFGESIHPVQPELQPIIDRLLGGGSAAGSVAETPSKSDLFDDAIADLEKKSEPTSAEPDALDEIARKLGLKSVVSKPDDVDDDLYAAIKPDLEKAYADFADEQDEAAQTKAFVAKLNERFSVDDLKKLKPYVVKFLDEQSSEPSNVAHTTFTKDNLPTTTGPFEAVAVLDYDDIDKNQFRPDQQLKFNQGDHYEPVRIVANPDLINLISTGAKFRNRKYDDINEAWVKEHERVLGITMLEAHTLAKDLAKEHRDRDVERIIILGNKPSATASAHDAATSPHNDLPEPSQAMYEAGNYKLGHFDINGLHISIENPVGSERSGIDRDGTPWSNTMSSHYGYIRNGHAAEGYVKTHGADGEHVDVFVKDGTPADFDGDVYVIDQIHPDTGLFDEHKIILGADNEKEARAIYQSNYAKDWKGLKAITAMPFEQFREWVLNHDHTQKPAEHFEREAVEKPVEAVEKPVKETMSTVVLDMLSDGEPHTYGELIGVGLSPTSVSNALEKLEADGKIRTTKKGYELEAPAPEKKPANAFDQVNLFGEKLTPKTEQPGMFDAKQDVKDRAERKTADYIANLTESDNPKVAKAASQISKAWARSEGPDTRPVFEDAANALDIYSRAVHTNTNIEFMIRQLWLDEGVKISDRTNELAKAMASGNLGTVMARMLAEAKSGLASRVSKPKGDVSDTLIDDKGDIDYGKVKDVAARVERGELEIRRLSPEVERGRVAGGRRNVEASLILGADERAGQKASAADGPRMDSHADTVKRQERILENYAKQNDIWFKPGHFPDRLYLGKGGEALVYQKDATRVAKLIDPREIDKSLTPQTFIDNRIALFNYLFPDSHYELSGFMRDADGKFRFVVTQPFIHGEGLQTQADIDSLMADKGLERTGGESYANDLYHVHDLHVGNVLKDTGGTVYVIDAVPKYNAEPRPFAVTPPQEKGLKSAISKPKEDMLTYIPPYSLSVLEDSDRLKGMEGKIVKRDTVLQALGGKGVKGIEKTIINEVLDYPEFAGKQMFPFDDFKRAVQMELMPLKLITSGSYADYGLDNTGINEEAGVYESAKAETHIWNTDLDHGHTGHFGSAFGDNARPSDAYDRMAVPMDYEIQSREQNGKTYYFVIPEGVTLTQENVEGNVQHVTTDKDNAERYLQWLKNRAVDAPNMGMYGHTRVWTFGKTAAIAENQSDVFQKYKAEDLVIESYEKKRLASGKLASADLEEKHDALSKAESDLLNLDPTGEWERWKRRCAEKISETIGNVAKYRKRLLFSKALKDSGLLDKIADRMAVHIKTLVDDGVWTGHLTNERVRSVLTSIEQTMGGKHSKPDRELNSALDQFDKERDESRKADGDALVYQPVRTLLPGLTRPIQVEDATAAELGKIMKGQLDDRIGEWLHRLNSDEADVKYFKETDESKEYLAYLKGVEAVKAARAAFLDALPLKDRQFIAHKKNNQLRLLREEIRHQARQGMEKVRIPTPRTLALIESYFTAGEDEDGNGTMPYDIERQSSDGDLEEGDTISYGGDTYTVIEAGYDYIKVVEEDKVKEFFQQQFVDDEVEHYATEARDELKQYNGSTMTVSEAEKLVHDALVMGDRDITLSQHDFEEGEVEDPEDYAPADPPIIFDYDSIDNDIRSYYDSELDNAEYIENYLEEVGYKNVVRNGKTFYYTEDDAHTEQFSQPSDYVDRENAATEGKYSIENFNINDFSDTEQTVLKGYEELNKAFVSEFTPQDADIRDHIVQDADGNEWLEADIPADLKDRPVKLFSRVAQPKVYAQQNEIGLYSAAEQAILDKMPEKADAAQVRNILSPANGVKAEELKWLDIDSFLKDNPSPTKQEVIDYIRANGTKVQEVNKYDPSEDYDERSPAPAGTADAAHDEVVEIIENDLHDDHANRDALLAAFRNNEPIEQAMERLGIDEDRFQGYDYLEEQWFEAQDSEEEQFNSGRMSEDDLDHRTKYHDPRWRLPGGHSYREILLTLPAVTPSQHQFPEALTELPDDYSPTFDRMADPDKQWSVTPDAQIHAKPFGGRFATKELAIKDAIDILNHRRTEAAIEKWRNEEGSKNFTAGHWDEPNVVAHMRVEDRTIGGKKYLHGIEFQSDWNEQGRKKGYLDTNQRTELPSGFNIKKGDDGLYRVHNEQGDYPATMVGYPNEKEAIEHFFATSDFARDEASGKVPANPYQSTKAWSMLLFRRFVKLAVDNGYDGVSWDTGDTNAERYGLAQVINSAALFSAGDGRYRLTLEDKSDLEIDPYRGSGKEVDRAELEETVGKELAAKLIDGAELVKDKPWPENVRYNPAYFTARGLDLKLGGKAMRGFYDQIMVNNVNDFVKKFGAKVEDKAIDVLTTWKEHDASGTESKPIPVHTVEFTPELVGTATVRGFPLFHKRPADAEDYMYNVLPNAHTQTILEGTDSSFDDKSGALWVSPEGMEDIRRTMGEEHVRYYGTEADETPFDGTIQSSSYLHTLVALARELTAEYEKKGYTPEQLAKREEMWNNVERLAEKSKDYGVLFTFEDALPEELFHQQDLRAGRTDAEAISKLKGNPIWNNPGKRFLEDYPDLSDDDKASELAAKLATNQAGKYGWNNIPDFEARKKEFLNTWADGILRKNADFIQSKGVDAFIRKFKEIAHYADLTTSETSERPQGPGAGRSGPGARSTSRGEESQSQAQAEAAQGSQEASGDRSADDERAIGIRNSVVDQERERRNLPAAMQAAKQTFGGIWDEAMKELAKSPDAAINLINDLRYAPRPVTGRENALILHRQIELQNAHSKALASLKDAMASGDVDKILESTGYEAGLIDALLDIYNVGKAVGTENALGLAVRAMLAKEDYSLAKLIWRERAARGGDDLTEEQTAKLRELSDAIAEAHDAYDVAAEKGEKLQDKLDRLKKEISEATKDVKDAYNKNLTLSPEIAAELKRMRSQLGTSEKEKATINEILSDVETLAAEQAAEFVKQGKELASTTSQLGQTEAALDEATMGLDERDQLIENLKRTVAAWKHKALAEGKAGRGVSMSATYKKLLTEKNDILSTIRDAFPNAGLKSAIQKPDQTETDEFKNWFGKSVVTKAGQPRVMYHGTYADFDEFKPSDTGIYGGGIYLTSEPNEAEIYADSGNGGNIVPVYAAIKNPIGQKELDRILERYDHLDEDSLEFGEAVRGDIEDLGYDGIFARSYQPVGEIVAVAYNPEQIKSATGNRGTFDPNEPSILKSAVSPPDEFNDDTRDALVKYTAIQIFEHQSYDDTIAMIRAATDGRLSDNEISQIHADAVGLTEGEPDELTPEEQAKADENKETQRENRQKLAEHKREAKAYLGEEPGTVAEKAEKGEKTVKSGAEKLNTLDSKILSLAGEDKKSGKAAIIFGRIKNVKDWYGVISKLYPELTVKEKDKLFVDAWKLRKDAISAVNRDSIEKRAEHKLTEAEYQAALTQMQAKQAVARREIGNAEAHYTKLGRNISDNVQKAFLEWRRFALLSSPIVLGKLTAAAMVRLISSPVEDAISMVGGLVPIGLNKVAKRAPRHGITSAAAAKAEGAAWASFLTGVAFKDAWQTLKTGQSDLDVIHGGPKLEDTIIPLIKYFGYLHGALKAPVKRAEFEKSLARRLAWGITNGVDVSNIYVQAAYSQLAYQDALRAIFMQDNWATNVYRGVLTWLEKKNKKTNRPSVPLKLVATGMRTMLPIVTVPTNIIGEAMEYSLGLGTGTVRLAWAWHKGWENLEPEEADHIARLLKKGLIGAALILLGYFNADHIGGYYQKGDRDPNDVPWGSIRMFGWDVPSWLLHSPLLEMMQIGATIRRVSDSKFRKKDELPRGLPAGILAGAWGLVKEVPFVSEMTDMQNLENWEGAKKYVSDFGKSIIVPQLLQAVATRTDKNVPVANGIWKYVNTPTVKRDPKNFGQNLLTGIPGLRETVPEKQGNERDSINYLKTLKQSQSPAEQANIDKLLKPKEKNAAKIAEREANPKNVAQKLQADSVAESVKLWDKKKDDMTPEQQLEFKRRLREKLLISNRKRSLSKDDYDDAKEILGTAPPHLTERTVHKPIKGMTELKKLY